MSARVNNHKPNLLKKRRDGSRFQALPSPLFSPKTSMHRQPILTRPGPKLGCLTKARNVFYWWLIVASIPFHVWLAGSMASEVYAFSKHGVAKRAKVISLDHTATGKGATIRYYTLEIDGRRVSAGFPCLLPAGQTVSVLVLPDAPEAVRLGDQNSSWFDLVASDVGGRFMAGLLLAWFLFVICIGPNLLLTMIRTRRAFFRAEP